MNYERGVECKHGHLARKCPHCELAELEAENERLKAQLAANTALLEDARKTIDELRVALKWQNLKGGD